MASRVMEWTPGGLCRYTVRPAVFPVNPWSDRPARRPPGYPALLPADMLPTIRSYDPDLLVDPPLTDFHD